MGVSIKLVTNNGDEDNELEKNVQDKKQLNFMTDCMGDKVQNDLLKLTCELNTNTYTLLG